MTISARVEFSPEHASVPGMSQCVRAGDTVYVSGQVAFDENGALVSGAEAQAEQCFRNLAGVLAGVGSELADVVKLTVFLADAEHYPAYAAAKSRFMGELRPAGTAIVAGLLHPEFCFELEAIAVSPEGR